MKTATTWLVVLLAAAAAGGGGFWFGRHGAAAKEKEEDTPGAAKAEPKPVASVEVAPLRRELISQTIASYGTVVAPPSEVRAVSVPFESRVVKMLVTPGQTVKAGEVLLEVEGSAATSLLFDEARNAVAAAERDQQLVQQRYEQKLATNTELFTAQNTLRTAQGRLQSLQQGGAGGARQLKAEVAGIVSKVDVQLGQVVPIGGPLVEVAAQDRIEVRLSAEPEDIPFMKVGQAVRLTPVADAAGPPIEGKIRLVGQRVDPATRLVDVMVSLPAEARLMLETFVSGQAVRAAADALVVPRDAVLPAEGGGFTLFTVKDNKAVKHAVTLGIETDQDVQVKGEDLKEGDSVVVVGNYVLDDGMDVQMQPAPPASRPADPDTAAAVPADTQPTATQPSPAQPAATQPAASAPAGENATLDAPATTTPEKAGPDSNPRPSVRPDASQPADHAASTAPAAQTGSGS